mmetsp:Transcript_9170/g.41750  ORF Transcript_9170/g.41750 Transcript_9170/m.41750 type:complete len:277 (+) Transcript_9170:118-948(+)
MSTGSAPPSCACAPHDECACTRRLGSDPARSAASCLRSLCCLACACAARSKWNLAVLSSTGNARAMTCRALPLLRLSAATALGSPSPSADWVSRWNRHLHCSALRYTPLNGADAAKTSVMSPQLLPNSWTMAHRSWSSTGVHGLAMPAVDRVFFLCDFFFSKSFFPFFPPRCKFARVMSSSSSLSDSIPEGCCDSETRIFFPPGPMTYCAFRFFPYSSMPAAAAAAARCAANAACAARRRSFASRRASASAAARAASTTARARRRSLSSQSRSLRS